MLTHLKKLTVLAAALALAACARQPLLPDAAQPLSPAKAGLLAGKPAAVEARWWREFNAPQLDALIEQALVAAPSLLQARARILRAAAAEEAAGAAAKPAVGLGFDATRQRYTEHGLIPPPLAGTQRTTASLQAGLTYDWDFFGRHQAQLAAAIGASRAAEADAAAARLMLAGQITRSYLALARIVAQGRLLELQMADSVQSLALVQQRFAAGLDNSQTLRAAESPLPELRRQALLLDGQASLLRHQLAALSVQPAAALRDLAPVLSVAAAANSASGIGLDLLGRRPDVVAARWRVEAATQQVTLARAQFYPNISLNAFAGFSSIGMDRLLQSGSRQFGFGPSLRLPLFDAGQLSAQLRGSAAEVDSAVASYNAALLEAVRDASDQLSSLQSLQLQQQEQGALLANSQANLALARQRFEAGIGGRQALLNARQALLLQQRASLELQGLTLEAQARLMVSLGGGWQDAAEVN
jgi:NodT family efflux transporter outer membrane factor (OMF) lipoprotein